MLVDNTKKKFSISMITDKPRKSVIKIDSRYEFHAPKYFDFQKEQEFIEKNKNLFNEEYIDPWFFIDHKNEPLKAAIQINENEMINVIGKNEESKPSIDELLKMHNDKVNKKRKVNLIY